MRSSTVMNHAILWLERSSTVREGNFDRSTEKAKRISSLR